MQEALIHCPHCGAKTLFRFEPGRHATIVGIPTERWNCNCVTARWDDAREPIETPHETTEGRAFTVGCWSFEWAEEQEQEADHA